MSNLTLNKIKINSVSKTSMFDVPYYVSNNKKFYKNYRWKNQKKCRSIIKIYIIG